MSLSYYLDTTDNIIVMLSVNIEQSKIIIMIKKFSISSLLFYYQHLIMYGFAETLNVKISFGHSSNNETVTLAELSTADYGYTRMYTIILL